MKHKFIILFLLFFLSISGQQNNRVNVNLNFGFPQVTGYGLEFFFDSKKKTSLYFNYGGKKFFSKPFDLILENYEFFDFSLNYNELGINYFLNKNIYLSGGFNHFNFYLDYDNEEGIRAETSLLNKSPIIKIGFKLGGKIYLKTEVGYNFKFPEKIYGKGVLNNINVTTTLNPSKIPLINKNSFVTASFVIGFGFF